MASSERGHARITQSTAEIAEHAETDSHPVHPVHSCYLFSSNWDRQTENWKIRSWDDLGTGLAMSSARKTVLCHCAGGLGGGLAGHCVADNLQPARDLFQISRALGGVGLHAFHDQV